MAIVVLPQKQPTQNQTGMGQFVQGLNPMLQAAFAQALQNKAYQFQLQKQMEMKQKQAELDRQNTQKTLEQFGAYTKTPETQSFMQPSAEYPQGINLPIPGKFKESYDLSKLPEGVKIGSGGDMSFQAPDPFSQYYKALVAGMTGKPTTDQSTGETPVIPGMGITGVSLGKGGGRLTFDPAKSEKLKEEKQARENKTQFIKDTAQDTLNTIREVKAGINYFGATGPIPTLNPWGYDRKRWEVNINRLLSSKIIDLMTTMKEASKTGATGFGQLSEKEGQILREASTSLNKGLSPKDAKKYLDEMENSLKKVVGESQLPPGFSSDEWEVVE